MAGVNVLKELAAALAAGGADKPPEGWKTTAQWSAEGGVSERQTLAILTAGITAGKVEAKSFRVPIPSGVVRNVRHFRVIA